MQGSWVAFLHRFGFAALFFAGVFAADLTPPAGAADAPASETADGFAQGTALFHDRKFAEAIVALDGYLAAHPRAARALVLRGDAKANLAQNEAALKDYNTAIGIAPEYQYAYVTRCETRLQLEDRAGALADCDAAIRLDPSDPLAFEDRADVQFQRESYDLALSDYDRAIGLGRNSAYVYAARCDTERLVGKRDRAKGDCEKALAIDPQSRRGRWARARLSIVEKRYTDGIADLNAYITQQPQQSDTGYYFRGLAYNRVMSYRQALEDLRTYVQRHPEDPDGYKERAIADYALGDKDAARADLDEAQTRYRKLGDVASVDEIVAMQKAIGAGNPLP